MTIGAEYKRGRSQLTIDSQDASLHVEGCDDAELDYPEYGRLSDLINGFLTVNAKVLTFAKKFINEIRRKLIYKTITRSILFIFELN